MPAATATVQLTQTQVLGVGQVFDGGNRRYNLSGGSQSERQPPVIEVRDGGTVRNVIIGPLAADEIHCLGNCTLDHVWWEDTGEDAATALGPAGTVMTVNGGAAFNGADKTFQFNGRGELRISNFYAASSGKLVRSCGDCTGNGGPRRIFVNSMIGDSARHIRHGSIAELLAVGGCALEIDIPEDPQSVADELQAAPFGVTVGGGFLTVSNESGLVYKVSQTSGDIAGPTRITSSSAGRAV